MSGSLQARSKTTKQRITRVCLRHLVEERKQEGGYKRKKEEKQQHLKVENGVTHAPLTPVLRVAAITQERRRTKIFPFFCFSSKVSSILLGKQDQETLSINQNQNRTKIFRACIFDPRRETLGRTTKCNFWSLPFSLCQMFQLGALRRRAELELFRRMKRAGNRSPARLV